MVNCQFYEACFSFITNDLYLSGDGVFLNQRPLCARLRNKYLGKSTSPNRSGLPSKPYPTKNRIDN
ncbi:hypothetical protein BVX98_01515 [bacterium F11]|nr:hypothetical protein BVX98_01515 [bacterium F11]